MTWLKQHWLLIAGIVAAVFGLAFVFLIVRAWKMARHKQERRRLRMEMIEALRNRNRVRISPRHFQEVDDLVRLILEEQIRTRSSGTTAGGASPINPATRAKRLNEDHRRLRELHQRGGLFEVESAEGDPPDHYVLLFKCKGIARLEADKPIITKCHRVDVVLPSGYPGEAPGIVFQTPIFHPNVGSASKSACMGTWSPSRSLGEIVLMLGRMIQYQAYGLSSTLNGQAEEWVREHKALLPVDDRFLLNPRQKAKPKRDDLDIRILR